MEQRVFTDLGVLNLVRLEGSDWSFSASSEQRIAELERRLGRLALENDFLRRAFQASKGSIVEQQRVWRNALYGEVMQLGGQVGIIYRRSLRRGACESRAGFYRHLDEHAPRQAETGSCGESSITRSVWTTAAYGSRRVTAELRAQGHLVNRKRVVRLMQADNLLCLRRRQFCLYNGLARTIPIASIPTLQLTGSRTGSTSCGWLTLLTSG